METSHTRQLKLKKLSRVGQWICLASLLLIIGYCIFLATDSDEATALLRVGVPGPYTSPSLLITYLAELVFFVPIAIFVVALWQTHKMFGLIGNGQFLSDLCRNILVRLGCLAIAGSVLSILCHTLSVLLITSANPPGQKILQINIDSGQISTVLGAVLLFTFALLVKDATAIAEENKQFI
jgi:Protein of unknown function (DUF2975)